MRVWILFLLIILLEGYGALYEGVVEPALGIHSDYWFTWAMGAAHNMQLILGFWAARILVDKNRLVLLGLIEAGIWTKGFDLVGMATVNLNRYDWVLWELGCFGVAVVINVFVFAKRNKKRLRAYRVIVDADKLKSLVEEVEFAKRDDWL